MEIGTVKWFNNAKGWGFISRDDGSDVFVHYSQIEGDGYRTLRQGQPVHFELKTGPRGQFAEQVRLEDELQMQQQQPS
jgi:CspA family cold shock protein